MKDVCSKCNELLETNRIGKQRYCKSCHASHMRTNRPRHNQLTDEQKLKANARSYLNVYIRRGKIIKQPCSVCNNSMAEGHHEDYTKPLQVIWYCRECHLKYHKKRPDVETPGLLFS